MRTFLRSVGPLPALRWLLAIAAIAAVLACLGIHARLRFMASASVSLKPDSVAKREGFGVLCKVDRRSEAALASGPGRLWGLAGGTWVRLPQFRQTESKRDVVERLDHAWRALGRNVWLGGRAAAPFRDQTEYEILIYSRRRSILWHLAAFGAAIGLSMGRLKRMTAASTLPEKAVAWIEAV